jgi:hypothetical protein
VYLYTRLTYIGNSGKKMTDETKSASEKAIEGTITCTSYLDSAGRLYVPLRVRDRAGLERGVGYEFGITGRVISDFKVMANE